PLFLLPPLLPHEHVEHGAHEPDDDPAQERGPEALDVEIYPERAGEGAGQPEQERVQDEEEEPEREEDERAREDDQDRSDDGGDEAEDEREAEAEERSGRGGRARA